MTKAPPGQTEGKSAVKSEEKFHYCIFSDATTDMQKWRKYLVDNARLDDLLPDTIPTGCYKVLVSFAIDTSGMIRDVSVVKDPGYGLGKMVADVVARYRERWIPATENGKARLSYHQQPFSITVEEDDDDDEACQDMPIKDIL
jgi:protein TonB